MAKLTWEKGPVNEFPWLDLTTLGKHFADQHFLFHVLQGPFVETWGQLNGSRVSSVFFAVICLMGMSLVFYKLKLRPFWLWTLALALANPFATRLVLGKASPLAILYWAVGSSATACLMIFKPKRKMLIWALVFIASLLFALTHGGWIILPGSIFLLMAGEILFQKALASRPLTQAIRQAPWSALIVSCLGIVTGLLLHPGRKELWDMFWLQVIKVGLITPHYTLPMGQEWDAASPHALLAMTSVFGMVLLLTLPGLLFARKANIEKTEEVNIHLVVIWSFLVAVLMVATLKSARFAEYWQPALAIWTAALAQLLDWKRLADWLNLSKGWLGRNLLPAIISIGFAVILFNSVWGCYTALRNQGRFMDNQYLGATQAISQAAQPGDRVYHSQWDEFPILFARDQRLNYIAGLDPNFFYEATSTLAMDYFNLAMHGASTTKEQAWDVIHNRLRAKFVMVDSIRWPFLANLIDKDPRYLKIGEGQGGRAYRVTNNE